MPLTQAAKYAILQELLVDLPWMVKLYWHVKETKDNSVVTVSVVDGQTYVHSENVRPSDSFSGSDS